MRAHCESVTTLCKCGHTLKVRPHSESVDTLLQVCSHFASVETLPEGVRTLKAWTYFRSVGTLLKVQPHSETVGTQEFVEHHAWTVVVLSKVATLLEGSASAGWWPTPAPAPSHRRRSSRDGSRAPRLCSSGFSSCLMGSASHPSSRDPCQSPQSDVGGTCAPKINPLCCTVMPSTL